MARTTDIFSDYIDMCINIRVAGLSILSYNTNKNQVQVNVKEQSKSDVIEFCNFVYN